MLFRIENDMELHEQLLNIIEYQLLNQIKSVFELSWS